MSNIREQLLALADSVDRGATRDYVSNELRSLAAEPVGGEVKDILRMADFALSSSTPNSGRIWSEHETPRYEIRMLLAQPDSAEGDPQNFVSKWSKVICEMPFRDQLGATDEGKGEVGSVGTVLSGASVSTTLEQPKAEGDDCVCGAYRMTESGTCSRCGSLVVTDDMISAAIDAYDPYNTTETITSEAGICAAIKAALSAAPQPELGVGVDVVRDGTHVIVRLGNTIHYSQFHQMTQPERSALDDQAYEAKYETPERLAKPAATANCDFCGVDKGQLHAYDCVALDDTPPEQPARDGAERREQIMSIAWKSFQKHAAYREANGKAVDNERCLSAAMFSLAMAGWFRAECDCHEYPQQVCDICQRVADRTKQDAKPPHQADDGAVAEVVGFARGLPDLEWTNTAPLAKGDKLYTAPPKSPGVGVDDAMVERARSVFIESNRPGRVEMRAALLAALGGEK